MSSCLHMSKRKHPSPFLALSAKLLECGDAAATRQCDASRGSSASRLRLQLLCAILDCKHRSPCPCQPHDTYIVPLFFFSLLRFSCSSFLRLQKVATNVIARWTEARRRQTQTSTQLLNPTHHLQHKHAISWTDYMLSKYVRKTSNRIPWYSRESRLTG
jgi:hypothetical protein